MGDLSNTLSYALTYVGFNKSEYPTVSVKSSVDGHTYNVRDMPDKQAAADMMARIRLKIHKLKMHVEEKFPDKKQVKQLTRNFEASASRIKEATPDAEFTSYSTNKGESIHFCLRHRDGDDESLVHEDIVTFVAIH
jgi:hypothetical protein